jgi:hypothetical protein
MVLTLKDLRVHPAFATLAKETHWQTAHALPEVQVKTFRSKLGFAMEEGAPV